MGEIDLDELKIKQQKLRQAAEGLKAIALEIEEYEQTYSWFSRLCKVCDKDFLHSIVMSEISNIMADDGKKIVVKWK